MIGCPPLLVFAAARRQSRRSPISLPDEGRPAEQTCTPPAESAPPRSPRVAARSVGRCPRRSEEHTSELQSRSDLVCRLLLEKKKKKKTSHPLKKIKTKQKQINI